MKLLIPLLAFIGFVSCDFYVNTAEVVKKCEEKHDVPASERAIWWSYKIPIKPSRCYMACIFKAFNWIDKKGNPRLNVIKRSYKAVGHESSAPDQKFLNKNCGKKLPAHPCDKAVLLYACFLVRTPIQQHFRDVFNGKAST